jgi:hypothetical protein
MKNIWMSLLAIVVSVDTFSQTNSIKNLIGRWETADGAGIEIIDSSRIFSTYGVQAQFTS